MSNELAQIGAFGDRGVVPRSMEEMLNFAGTLHSSGLAPASFKNPQQIFIAMAMAMECNLPILRGLSCIAVINGRACLWGDVLLAKVQTSGLLESYSTSYRGVPYNDDFCAIIKIKRKGLAEHTSIFSVQDAKDAGLWDKAGPWKNYPQRMLLSRARAFALRDMFPDVLLGLGDREEQEDIRTGAIEVETADATPRVSLGAQSQPATPAKSLPEAEKTVQLAPRKPREEKVAAPAELREEPKPAAAAPAEAAASDAADVHFKILEKLKDHPAGLSEEDFVSGLRAIGRTNRPDATLANFPVDRLNMILAQFDRLAGQVVDKRTADEEEARAAAQAQ